MKDVLTGGNIEQGSIILITSNDSLYYGIFVGCTGVYKTANGIPYANSIHYMYLNPEEESLRESNEFRKSVGALPNLSCILSRASHRIMLLPDSNFPHSYIEAVNEFREMLRAKGKFNSKRHKYFNV